MGIRDLKWNFVLIVSRQRESNQQPPTEMSTHKFLTLRSLKVPISQSWCCIIYFVINKFLLGIECDTLFNVGSTCIRMGKKEICLVSTIIDTVAQWRYFILGSKSSGSSKFFLFFFLLLSFGVSESRLKKRTQMVYWNKDTIPFRQFESELTLHVAENKNNSSLQLECNVINY